jgi:hypothetical protein
VDEVVANAAGALANLGNEDVCTLCAPCTVYTIHTVCTPIHSYRHAHYKHSCTHHTLVPHTLMHLPIPPQPQYLPTPCSPSRGGPAPNSTRPRPPHARALVRTMRRPSSA